MEDREQSETTTYYKRSALRQFTEENAYRNLTNPATLAMISIHQNKSLAEIKFEQFMSMSGLKSSQLCLDKAPRDASGFGEGFASSEDEEYAYGNEGSQEEFEEDDEEQQGQIDNEERDHDAQSDF